MDSSNKFTLENIIEECGKCIVLCRACHRIETDISRKNGEIKIYTAKHHNKLESILNCYGGLLRNLYKLNSILLV